MLILFPPASPYLLYPTVHSRYYSAPATEAPPHSPELSPSEASSNLLIFSTALSPGSDSTPAQLIRNPETFIAQARRVLAPVVTASLAPSLTP